MFIKILSSAVIGVIAYIGGKWYLSEKNINVYEKRKIYISGSFFAAVFSLLVQIIFQIQLADIFR